jgi:hypothetical protein
MFSIVTTQFYVATGCSFGKADYFVLSFLKLSLRTLPTESGSNKNIASMNFPPLGGHRKQHVPSGHFVGSHHLTI